LFNGWTQSDFLHIPKIPQGFSDVFILNTSDKFRGQIEKKYHSRLEVVFNDYHLWLGKLTKINNIK
jgi:hypothetical protein